MTQEAKPQGPLDVWRRKNGYLHRGKMPEDAKGTAPQVPYEVMPEEEWGKPNENSERYWKAFGYEREAPIIDYKAFE